MSGTSVLRKPFRFSINLQVSDVCNPERATLMRGATAAYSPGAETLHEPGVGPTMDQYRPGVLLVVSSLLLGGAEKHAVALANLLDTTRFRLTLCCVRAGDTLAGELDASRLDAFLELDVRQKFSWQAVERLAREIDRQSIDIVVCANGYPVLYALAASLRARRSVRVVEVFHTTRPGSLKARARMLLNWLLFRRCELLIYVSHTQRRYWRARGLRARRDVVIQNGVDIEHFTCRLTDAQRAQTRAGFGFAPGDYVIGLCASLRREKAHEDLLLALQRLRQAGVPAKALLIGDGPRRAHIEQRIAQLQLQGAVVITGYKPDVRPCIACCDVMTLTSHAVETFSIAALESMALGKPLVMSRIGGAAEQVQPGVNGLLFEPGDIATLAQHLAALADPQVRQTMGEAARRIVRAAFTVERMTAAYTSELLALGNTPQQLVSPLPG
jgi:glycosyltransferase involved in cell wall biosynthesis